MIGHMKIRNVQLYFLGVGHCAPAQDNPKEGDKIGGDIPELGYPLTHEEIEYAHSKEFQETLKNQTYDEIIDPDLFEGDILQDEETERILQERGVEGLREVKKNKAQDHTFVRNNNEKSSGVWK